MGYKNIMISSNTNLRVKNSQLIIGEEEHSIPIEDINSVIVENQTVLMSAYLLNELSENGVVVYICDKKHLPSTVIMPMLCHSRHYKMLKVQMNSSKPLQKRLWQQVVVKKIQNQAKCLQYLNNKKYGELYRMTNEVQSGDKTNVEAKAAAFYFKELVAPTFYRDEESVINSALDYGYAIIRGMVARTLVSYGFEPAIGIFHHNELNSFNLADDLMEPFRPVVDLYVMEHFDYAEVESGLSTEIKRGLVSLIGYDMEVNGEKNTVSNCIDKLVSSFSACILGNREELWLPELIPQQMHRYE